MADLLNGPQWSPAFSAEQMSQEEVVKTVIEAFAPEECANFRLSGTILTHTHIDLHRETQLLLMAHAEDVGLQDVYKKWWQDLNISQLSSRG